jgi:hypothetical protein
MHKRSSKDMNQIAAFVLNAVIKKTEPPQRVKNRAAVALGRLGGKKGGPARAEKLSPLQRSEIARKAALSRWKGK